MMIDQKEVVRVAPRGATELEERVRRDLTVDALRDVHQLLLTGGFKKNHQRQVVAQRFRKSSHTRLPARGAGQF